MPGPASSSYPALSLDLRILLSVLREWPGPPWLGFLGKCQGPDETVTTRKPSPRNGDLHSVHWIVCLMPTSLYAARNGDDTYTYGTCIDMSMPFPSTLTSTIAKSVNGNRVHAILSDGEGCKDHTLQEPPSSILCSHVSATLCQPALKEYPMPRTSCSEHLVPCLQLRIWAGDRRTPDGKLPVELPSWKGTECSTRGYGAHEMAACRASLVLSAWLMFWHRGKSGTCHKRLCRFNWS